MVFASAFVLARVWYFATIKLFASMKKRMLLSASQLRIITSARMEGSSVCQAGRGTSVRWIMLNLPSSRTVNLTGCPVVFPVNYRARNVGKDGQKVQWRQKARKTRRSYTICSCFPCIEQGRGQHDCLSSQYATKTKKMGLELSGDERWKGWWKECWRWQWICWCVERGALSLCWYDVTYNFLNKFCYRGYQEQCRGSGTIFPDPVPVPDPTLATFGIHFRPGTKSGSRPNLAQFRKKALSVSSEMDLAERRFIRWVFIKERGEEVFRKIRLFPILCEPFKDSAPPFTAGGYYELNSQRSHENSSSYRI